MGISCTWICPEMVYMSQKLASVWHVMGFSPGLRVNGVGSRSDVHMTSMGKPANSGNS